MPLTDQELLFFFTRLKALPVYEALRREALALGGTQLRVQKTQITFGSPRGYCVVAHPPARRMSDEAILCCLSLGYPLNHSLCQHNVQVGLHRFTCRLLLKSVEDVNAILPFLKEAYEGFGSQ